MSVFFDETIASPMSEDCCHDTSVSNVYIAAWQEIVKLAKVIAVSYVCFIVRSIQITRCIEHNNGQIGQGLCVKHVSRRSSHTCSSEKLLYSNIYAVEMHPWQKCYCSWSENCLIHLSQTRKLPLPPFASATTFYIPFFLSATSDMIRALSNGTTKTCA